MKKSFSEEDRILVRDMLLQGHTLRFVADTLGRDASVVRRWATRLSLVNSHRPWSEEDKAKALALRARGAKAGEIAEALDRSSNAVSAFLAGVRREEDRIRALPPPPPPPAPRDIYVQWVIAQEYLRRKNNLTLKTGVL